MYLPNSKAKGGRNKYIVTKVKKEYINIKDIYEIEGLLH